MRDGQYSRSIRFMHPSHDALHRVHTGELDSGFRLPIQFGIAAWHFKHAFVHLAQASVLFGPTLRAAHRPSPYFKQYDGLPIWQEYTSLASAPPPPKTVKITTIKLNATRMKISNVLYQLTPPRSANARPLARLDASHP
jgi:hypothetical protein